MTEEPSGQDQAKDVKRRTNVNAGDVTFQMANAPAPLFFNVAVAAASPYEVQVIFGTYDVSDPKQAFPSVVLATHSGHFESLVNYLDAVLEDVKRLRQEAEKGQ